MRLRLQEPVDYFLKRSLANHHLLVRGDHSRMINDFIRYSGTCRLK